MFERLRIESSDLLGVSGPCNPALRGLRRLELKGNPDDISIGLSIETDPRNYKLVLERLARSGHDIISRLADRLPAEHAIELPWSNKKGPEHRPEAPVLSERFHREIFLFEVRAFFLSAQLPLNDIRVFQLHLGKEHRHLVVINTDFPESLKEDVHDWRSRIQKRHGVHLRFNNQREKLSPTQKFLRLAEENGILGSEQNIENLLTGLTRPQLHRGERTSIEDHRKIPLLTIDDHKIHCREDAHLGVPIPDGYYVDTHFPIYEIQGEGFKKGQDILTLAIGYELSSTGIIGELQVRQALARNYLPLSFSDVNIQGGIIDLEAPFSNSAETLYQAAAAHRLSQIDLRARSIEARSLNGEEVITELMLAAERVFAKECLRLHTPVIARALEHPDRALVSIAQSNLPDFKNDLDWPSLSLGNAVLKLRDMGQHGWVDYMLDLRQKNQIFFVLEGPESSSNVRARAKARRLDGQINQRQWLSTVRGEDTAYTTEELGKACEILNERNALKAKRIAMILSSLPAGLSNHIGETVEASVIHSKSGYSVYSGDLSVLGRIATPPSVHGLALKCGENIRTKVQFLGLDLNQNELVFALDDQAIAAA